LGGAPGSALSSSPAASSAHMASVGPVTSAHVFDWWINVFASTKSQPRTRLVATMHSMIEAPEDRSSLNASSRTKPSANRLRNCLLKSRGYILTPNGADHRPGAGGIRFGTGTLSPGSVHLLCWTTSLSSLNIKMCPVDCYLVNKHRRQKEPPDGGQLNVLTSYW
jgi:hypothetical protein